MAVSNPYKGLPETAFWRSAVGRRDPRSICRLWRAKFTIAQPDMIVTAGSCFAQHIGRALTRDGYSWYDANRRRRTYLQKPRAASATASFPSEPETSTPSHCCGNGSGGRSALKLLPHLPLRYGPQTAGSTTRSGRQ